MARCCEHVSRLRILCTEVLAGWNSLLASQGCLTENGEKIEEGCLTPANQGMIQCEPAQLYLIATSVQNNLFCKI